MTVSVVNSVEWNDFVSEEQHQEVGVFVKQYNNELLEYKQAARKAIADKLGFEPVLEASLLEEFSYRCDLKKYDDGEITKDELEDRLSECMYAVRSYIIDEFPEQRELALKHKADQQKAMNEEFERRYKEENIEYSKEARKIIFEGLGYRPPLAFYRYWELEFRYNLKRLDNGQLEPDRMKKYFTSRLILINNRVLKELPNYKHLAEKYTETNPFGDGSFRSILDPEYGKV